MEKIKDKIMEKIKDKLYDFFANYVDNKHELLSDKTDIDELVDRTARFITRGMISIYLYQHRDRLYHKSDIEDEIAIQRDWKHRNIDLTQEEIEKVVDIYEEYLGNDDSWSIHCKDAIADYLESKGEQLWN